MRTLTLLARAEGALDSPCAWVRRRAARRLRGVIRTLHYQARSPKFPRTLSRD